MFNPFSPAHVIRHQLLNPEISKTPSQIAADLELSIEELYELLMGAKKIDDALAGKIATLTNTSKQYWLDIEADCMDICNNHIKFKQGERDGNIYDHYAIFRPIGS